MHNTTIYWNIITPLLYGTILLFVRTNNRRLAMRTLTVTVVRDGELFSKFEVRAAEWSSNQLINAIEQLFTGSGWLPYTVAEAEADDYLHADQYCTDC